MKIYGKMGYYKKLSDQIRSAKRSKKTILGSRDGLPFEISLKSISETDRYQRSLDKERLKKFNDDIKAWSIHCTSQLRMNVRMMVKHDKKLSSSIEPNVYHYKGEANRIGFSFAREGVYIHKGAGRGQGGFKGGSKWMNRKGEVKSTDPTSYFKMGQGNRKPVEWFDPVIKKNLPYLADVVAEYAATMQMDATNIFID